MEKVMSHRILYLILAVSVGLNIGLVGTTLIHRADREPHGLPQGPGPNQGPAGGPDNLVDEHLRGMTRHLDLDQEQQVAIRQIMEHYASELAVLQDRARTAAGRLADGFAHPVFEPAHFKELTEEASLARARVDSLSGVMLVAEAEVLTPEQRRKFAEVAPVIHSSPRRPGRGGGPPPRKPEN
jgi:Spy/CpxP family protein refolding chaperone